MFMCVLVLLSTCMMSVYSCDRVSTMESCTDEMCGCIWCWDGSSNITNGICDTIGTIRCSNYIRGAPCDDGDASAQATIIIGAILGGIVVMVIIMMLLWFAVCRRPGPCPRYC